MCSKIDLAISKKSKVVALKITDIAFRISQSEQIVKK